LIALGKIYHRADPCAWQPPAQILIIVTLAIQQQILSARTGNDHRRGQADPFTRQPPAQILIIVTMAIQQQNLSAHGLDDHRRGQADPFARQPPAQILIISTLAIQQQILIISTLAIQQQILIIVTMAIQQQILSARTGNDHRRGQAHPFAAAPRPEEIAKQPQRDTQHHRPRRSALKIL